jgi:hypothetical protein
MRVELRSHIRLASTLKISICSIACLPFSTTNAVIAVRSPALSIIRHVNAYLISIGSSRFAVFYLGDSLILVSRVLRLVKADALS